MKVVSEKQRRTREKYSKKGNKSQKVLVATLIITVISTFFALSDNIAKATNSTDDVMSMIMPIQINLVTPLTIIQEFGGKEVKITQIAEYKIGGRVVEAYDYSSGMAGIMKVISGNEYYNDISVKDVAIAYGPMALEKNHKKVEYVMTGSRRISYAIKDQTLFEDVGDLETVKTYITNNHLIAANEYVERLLKSINKDDYVEISGYLVKAEWKDGIYRYALESSTTREDTGNGACEVIYVENVKWIK